MPSSGDYSSGVTLWCGLFRVVSLWQESLSKSHQKTAASLADPSKYENLFPELQQALKAEQALKPSRSTPVPASNYVSAPVSSGCGQPFLTRPAVLICLVLGQPIAELIIFVNAHFFFRSEYSDI